ncbi:midasin-like isoform X2 [Carica papaya]|uniref:midasin-like isoform X2 n=1 Tax=Carica papaya TaxID=3649 RepID=UPI000B8CCC90|nr:midasin-like isoform X2 [Carica papaya]
MAIDGSFRLESAVDRFLARCPQLGRYPQLDSLAKKGDMVTEEEVVKVVADIFLHPNYTIPLIGCFRPIARKIVDKVVAMLHLVGNLGSSSDYIILLSDNSDDKLTLDNAMGQGVSVIDFYHQQGRSLHLHECACLAFCRALDLAPFLSGSVLTYFKFAPPPYERIANQEAICKMSRKDLDSGRTIGSGRMSSGLYLFQVNTSKRQAHNAVVASCLHVVHISYRFLMMEPEVFCELWDWSCFLDLVRKTLDMGSHLEFAKDISDVRWCAVQVLSIILRMNDRATASLGVGAEEALSCLLRWEEFCEDVAVEKAGMYIGSSDCTTMGSAVGQTEFSRVNCLQSFSTNSLVLSQLDGIEPSMKRRREDRSYGDPFVMTSTIKKSFEMALLAVSQNWPVLFYGPAGCGKSALIRKLAEETGNNVLSIHMDDQIDGKMLVGSYICTEQPGEFRWQPGSLTQAVLNGLWVVFENIDKAPSDVLPILVPLLEGASSFVTSHGEVGMHLVALGGKL